MFVVEEEDDDDRAAVRAFMQRRIEEMRAAMSRRQFGTVFELSDADDFLKATDDDSKLTTVLVHIYEPSVRLCAHIDKQWNALADKYTAFKFARIRVSSLNTSRAFQRTAVPTIQVQHDLLVVKREMSRPIATSSLLATLSLCVLSMAMKSASRNWSSCCNNTACCRLVLRNRLTTLMTDLILALVKSRTVSMILSCQCP